MAKRVILIAIIILGCTMFTWNNESKATISSNTDSGSESPAKIKNHKYRPPYRIVNSRYVSRSSIKRNIGMTNGVRISIKQNGMTILILRIFPGMILILYRMGNNL